ncbi:ABC transporter substrate-binding protein [Nocardia sp. NBC_00565]|uniref:ABC transporter substrate-binding protein n=1 Tax=Nocardia sp. NBC_00565 TaxID=2975993 RepID=UPI002E824776|nr:ABC transporter substrate-binding protein [Nocardia sp. NBC_00565]WUC04044.1 ABC transporter substrate-binding protein [Nocardia sp. NBC_00565]
MGTRRALLQAGLVLPLAACAPQLLWGDSGRVRIGVSWSGAELAAFRAVLARLAIAESVDVIPMGDDVGTAFTAGGKSAPDIVMLPQAGQVRDLVDDDRLRPIADGLWTDDAGLRYSEPWRQLLHQKGKPYGVPFKAADKSLVWYDRQAIERYRLGDPANWTIPDWIDRMEVLAGTPIRLLALAAGDGWVLTDFFENVLRAESPRTYDDLAVGQDNRTWDRPAVRAAFGHLARLWGQRHAFAGGVAVALTRQFPDAIRDVFEHGRAAMVIAPDFAEPIVRASLRAAGRQEDAVGIAQFPTVGLGGERPRIVGGDVVVVTKYAEQRADEVVAALAAPEAPLPWIEGDGGFIGPNLRTSARYSTLIEPIARSQTSWSAFDLSDQLGAVGARNGLWRILTAFLTTIGDGMNAHPERAIDTAITALDTFERGRR